MKKSDQETIARDIIETIETASTRLTSSAIEKHMADKYHVPRKIVRDALKSLLSRGEIVYTYLHGCSFIEKSFHRPVRVSPSVVLKPPDAHFPSTPRDIVISLSPGDAFGVGDHPTTRLAIRGLEYAFEHRYLKKEDPIQGVDIGTGSGVLGLAAIGFGVATVLGIDIDPVAVYESRKNAQLNGWEERFTGRELSVENLTGKYDLILANLRYPGLMKLHDLLLDISTPFSVVIISGIRPDEAPDIIDAYGNKQFSVRWKSHEKEWTAVVFTHSPLFAGS